MYIGAAVVPLFVGNHEKIDIKTRVYLYLYICFAGSTYHPVKGWKSLSWLGEPHSLGDNYTICPIHRKMNQTDNRSIHSNKM